MTADLALYRFCLRMAELKVPREDVNILVRGLMSRDDAGFIQGLDEALADAEQQESYRVIEKAMA